MFDKNLRVKSARLDRPSVTELIASWFLSELSIKPTDCDVEESRNRSLRVNALRQIQRIRHYCTEHVGL